MEILKTHIIVFVACLNVVRMITTNKTFLRLQKKTKRLLHCLSSQQCSQSCGSGVKTREIKCLDISLTASPDCDKSSKPSRRQSCNKHICDDVTSDSDRDKQAAQQNQIQMDGSSTVAKIKGMFHGQATYSSEYLLACDNGTGQLRQWHRLGIQVIYMYLIRLRDCLHISLVRSCVLERLTNDLSKSTYKNV